MTNRNTFLSRGFVAALFCSTAFWNGDMTAFAQQTATEANTRSVLYTTSRVTVTQDGDWVRWQFVEKLADGTLHVVYRGARAKDGNCEFTASGRRGKKVRDTVYIERTVAMNSNECLLETESATLDRADAIARSLVVADDKRPGTARVEPGEEAGSALQLESGFTFSGSIQTQVEDPINLDVADARSNIEWNANSSCITAWHRWPDWYWLSGSGWGLNSSAWSGTDPNSNWCSMVNQTTEGHYSNGIFCAFFDTWVGHNSTQYNAFPGGAAGWSWSSAWGGGCSSLLSFSTVIY
jgi:hypothetical protein